MSNVVPFPARCGKIFYPSREDVEVKGKPRERWVVVAREPNGNETFHPIKTKHDAMWLAAILRETEVKRRADLKTMEAHPLGQTIMTLSPTERDFMRKLLDAESRLRDG